MERCGVTFFDAYLLHNMGVNVDKKCCRYGAFERATHRWFDLSIAKANKVVNDCPASGLTLGAVAKGTGAFFCA